tara:strand:+ start:6061 stop:6384 length:324 start_codon:yes stop_codon:yes gene_type:complete
MAKKSKNRRKGPGALVSLACKPEEVRSGGLGMIIEVAEGRHPDFNYLYSEQDVQALVLFSELPELDSNQFGYSYAYTILTRAYYKIKNQAGQPVWVRLSSLRLVQKA